MDDDSFELFEPEETYIPMESARPSPPRRVRHPVDHIEGNHPCYLCGYLANMAIVAWDVVPDIKASENSKIVDRYEMWLCTTCVRVHHIVVDDPEETPTAGGIGT
jgi:hypothetical protein